MKKSDRLLWGLMLLVFGAFVYTIYGVIELRIIGVGDRAPNFAVTTESGQRITRSEFGGKLLLVNFWATWCPPCVEEMPSLNQFARTMAGEGVVVLGVSIDKSEKAYREFLQNQSLAFQVARDPEEKISSSYGTFMWPETYVINREGRVVQKYIGPKNWTDPQIMNSIRALL